MRHRPHIVVARPPHANAPRMYGRNIFRPSVRHRCAIAHTLWWRARHTPTHHGCTGEKYFAPTCAIDAQLPTRCDRAPATRRRTMDVRAKYFSPVRAPSIHHQPTIKHRHAPNRGTRPIRPHTTVVRAKNISPLRAPTISIRPTIKHGRTMNRGARPIRPRTTDVRAEYFSPGRTRLTRHRSHIGRQRATLRANDCVICRRAICWWRGRA